MRNCFKRITGGNGGMWVASVQAEDASHGKVVQIIRKDGREVWVRLCGRIFEEPDNNGMYSYEFKQVTKADAMSYRAAPLSESMPVPEKPETDGQKVFRAIGCMVESCINDGIDTKVIFSAIVKFAEQIEPEAMGTIAAATTAATATTATTATTDEALILAATAPAEVKDDEDGFRPSWAKLSNGEWGAWIVTVDAKIGAKVALVNRAGKTSWVRIVDHEQHAIGHNDQHITLCRVSRAQKPR